MTSRRRPFRADRSSKTDIMTEYEKMLHNLPYDYMDKEVQANILRAYYAMRDLNQCGAWDMDELHRCIHTLIGPNCQLLTPDHPHDYLERRKTIETGKPIRIGDDCWLGGGVIVCPGVTIGNRVIVGAGSVVTHDIPDDVVVAGNPAKIIKTI